MTRRARQLYLLIVAIAWVIILPSLLLYISGYRAHWRELKFEHTGSISLSSTPKSANVTITDVDETKATPALFNQLFPDTYTITIHKDGYIDWRDIVQVNAGQTVVVNSIILFKNTTEPQRIKQLPSDVLFQKFQANISDFSPAVQYALSEYSISVNSDIVIADVPAPTILDRSTQTLYLIRETGNEITIIQLATNVLGYEWDDDAEQLLFYSDYEINMYDSATQVTRTITRLSQPINTAIWHPRGGYILYSTQNYIEAIETRQTNTPNTHSLVTDVSASALTYNKKGTVLYYMVDNQLYSLELL